MNTYEISIRKQDGTICKYREYATCAFDARCAADSATGNSEVVIEVKRIYIS